MTPATIDSLCPTCGLCCNGVLFEDLRLRKSDDPARLRKLGLGSALARKGATTCLNQPCLAFDGSHCRIYADRPSRCREFECHILTRVAEGSLGLSAAHRRIRHARRLVAQVESELESLGNTERHHPLIHRYSEVMARPINLGAGSGEARRRGRLLMSVDALMRFAHKEFIAPSRTQPERNRPD